VSELVDKLQGVFSLKLKLEFAFPAARR